MAAARPWTRCAGRTPWGRRRQAVTESPSHSRRRWLRVTIQIVGFALGVASLVWCIRSALADKNREQLSLLLHAPLSLVAAMIGLSLLTLVTNGLLFWTALTPVKRLPVVGVLATNGV